jgi:hypothetical protein
VTFWQVGDQELPPGVDVVRELIVASNRVASSGVALILVVDKVDCTLVNRPFYLLANIS